MDETKRTPEQTGWAGEIQKELTEKRLSRRVLLDRLKGAGVGFGAAAVLGVNAASAGESKTATLASTNKVLNDIVAESQEARAKALGISPDMQNFRFFRRFYRRFYRRFFRRFYRRFFRPF